MRLRAIVVGQGLLVCALLAGCGDDDDAGSKSGGSDDAALVEEVMVAHLTDPDPDKCDRLYTDRYLEENFIADSPEDGAAKCREYAANDAAPEATVEDIEVDGDQATAVKVLDGFRGPGYDLVKEDGEWRIDYNYSVD